MTSAWFRNILMFTVAISVCTSAPAKNLLKEGAKAYQRGDYVAAAQNWEPIGRKGDSTAQWNMGRLWHQGHLTSAMTFARARPYDPWHNNLTEATWWYLPSAQQGNLDAMLGLAQVQLVSGHIQVAASWFTLGARYGDTRTYSFLNQLGLQIPQPDLQWALQQQDRAREAAALGIALGVGCAVMGCGSSGSQAVPQSQGSGRLLTAPKSVTCRLNPVFKDALGNPTVDCQER